MESLYEHFRGTRKFSSFKFVYLWSSQTSQPPLCFHLLTLHDYVSALDNWCIHPLLLANFWMFSITMVWLVPDVLNHHDVDKIAYQDQ